MSVAETSGKFISFEGGEGAGKSTALAAAVEAIRRGGHEVVQVREPGGTALGESIRSLLLAPDRRGMCRESELLLMFASRAQLVRETVLPALRRGAWVVADRFTDASFAYQGGGRGIDSGIIAELERWAAGRRPDLTLLLDLPVADGLQRVGQRGGERDRIEQESQAFFERVRQRYRELASADPERWTVIDASQPQQQVALDVQAAVRILL